MSLVRPLEARREVASDAAIVARIAGGDTDALGILYDRYASALVRYAARIERSDAEDVVQTVFIRVLRLAASFRSDAASARPWLYAITARVLQERSRALRRFGRTLGQFANMSRAMAATSPSETRRDLERGVKALSRAKSVVLILNEVEGFSCDEIASMLEIPVGTVWTRLHHARRELRHYYEGGHD